MQLQWLTSLTVESKRQTRGSPQLPPVWNDTWHQTAEYVAYHPHQTRFHKPRCWTTFHPQPVTSYCITDNNTATWCNYKSTLIRLPMLQLLHMAFQVSLQKLIRHNIISFYQQSHKHNDFNSFLWSPYVIGQTIIFSSCFFLSTSFFISSPNLSSQRLDVYHTSRYGVTLVRI